MKIIINDKTTGINQFEIVDISNINEHFKNLTIKQWEEIEKNFYSFEVFDDKGTSLYKWAKNQ